MLRDFSKIDTFLTVVREKSFSKASKKLGISQPAVTQQIKLLEDYLETQIVDRKKNGIRLTKEGEEIHKIMVKLDKCISNAEKDVFKIINKQVTFIIGSSFTIGNYILPNFLTDIKENIKNDVMIKVDNSSQIIEQLLEKKVDIALIEDPTFVENVMYREWMDDELILVSKTPLPKFVKKEELYTYDWICREDESHTRKIITEAFEEIGVDCKNFNLRSVVTSSTAVKQTILKSQQGDTPIVSIISKHIVEDEIESGQLHVAKVKGLKLSRKFYLAYLKDRKHDAFIDSVTNYLMSKRRL